MTPSETEAAPAGRWGKIPARWFDHPDVDADGIAVLAALSTFADRQGRCWPSQATLAGRLKRSRSWVSKMIARLAAAGLLEVRDRWSGNGGRLSSVYVLAMDAADGSREEAARNSPVTAADTPCDTGRQEHRNPEQNPDSRSGQAGEALRSVPDDWRPDAADLAWAQANVAGIDPHRHAEGFVLRCRAHGYRYRDVAAAWRAWLIEDAAAGRASGRASARATPAEGGAAGRSRTGDGQRLEAWAAVAASLRQGAAGHHPQR